MGVVELDYRFTERKVRKSDGNLPLTQQENPMTISDHDFHAAHAAIEAEPLLSDVEKAARAIASIHGDPDTLACNTMPRELVGRPGVWLVTQQRPLWTFFTHVAKAALSAVPK